MSSQLDSIPRTRLRQILQSLIQKSIPIEISNRCAPLQLVFRQSSAVPATLGECQSTMAQQAGRSIVRSLGRDTGVLDNGPAWIGMYGGEGANHDTAICRMACFLIFVKSLHGTLRTRTHQKSFFKQLSTANDLLWCSLLPRTFFTSRFTCDREASSERSIAVQLHLEDSAK